MERCRGILYPHAKGFLLTLLLATTAFGATIYSVTGPNEANWTSGESQFLYGSWTQTGTYENVSIAALLSGSGTATAYLTDQVGPTTTGADVIASTTVAYPGAATNVQLFSGLSLGPGTYYLVIGGTGSGTWPGTFSPVVTTDSGVTANGFGFCSVDLEGDECDNAFAPASVFAAYPGSMFSVEGDLGGVPEPATSALVASALLLAAVAGRKRFNA